METFIQPKITGYRQLNEDEAIAMNEIKALANQVGELTEKLKAAGADGRWLAIGVTQLQQGFMAVTRSIAKPTSF